MEQRMVVSEAKKQEVEDEIKYLLPIAGIQKQRAKELKKSKIKSPHNSKWGLFIILMYYARNPFKTAPMGACNPFRTVLNVP